MDSEAGGPASQGEPGGGSPGRRLSRRALLGGVSSGVVAGSAVWMVPEIFVTRPAAAASLSGPPVPGGGGGTPGTPTTGGGTTGSGPITEPASAPATGPGAGATAGPTAGTGSQIFSALAATGLNLERDAALGAALVAGGWAMERWASRQERQEEEASEWTGQAGPLPETP